MQLTSSSCFSPVLLCVIIFVAISAIVIQQLLELKQNRKYSDLRVSHMQWAYLTSNPQFMVQWLSKEKQKVPLLLHGTPFKSWETANWTLDTLASKSEDIGHVLSKKGSSNIFKYFAVDQPLSDVSLMREEKNYIEVIYTARTFFELVQGPFDDFYYYASGGAELLNLGELGSNESLRSMTFPSHLKAYSEHGQVNFWLGKTNVTAHTHYDTSYNFHFVVSGRKKFILLPPTSYSRLGLHPCLHQLYRQTSAEVLAEENNVEFLREVKGYEVELMDGDVLYIPPYWFHRVVTLNTTISLNIWSQSEAFLTMEKIYKSAIPFEVEWGRVKLMKTLNYFIQVLIGHLLAESEEMMPSWEFVLDRVYRRYEVALNKSSKDADPILSRLRNSVREYCLTEPISELLDEDTVKHLNGGVARIAEQFLGIDPSSVREINLANYVEHLVWRMLGTEDLLQLPVYLHECFNTAVT